MKYLLGIVMDISSYLDVWPFEFYCTAFFYSNEEVNYYTRIEGNIIVYTPQVKVGETYAQVYVHNGEDADYYNLITTGWMVKFLLTILILMHFNSSS